MPTKLKSTIDILDYVETYEELFDLAHHAQAAIRLLTKSVPPLSSDEIIQRGLILAKTNPTDQEVNDAMLYYGFMELKNKVAKTLTELNPLVPALMWNVAENQREDFRDRLKELMRSPAKAREKHQAADLNTLREHLLMISSVDDQGKSEIRFYPQTIEAGYKFVLTRIYSNADEKRWRRLRECPHCHSYFMRKASRLGGRPRDYCTAQCQKEADQKNALKRQKRARQRK